MNTEPQPKTALRRVLRDEPEWEGLVRVAEFPLIEVPACWNPR